MGKARKTWTLRSAKPAAAAVPPGLKELVQAQAHRFIDTELAPRIPAPRMDPQFSYLVGISTAWWRQYFYFISTYRIPDPTAVPPTRDFKYARLEYVGRNRFHLAWMRHTGQWFTVYQNLTLAECFQSIAEDEFFAP